MAKPDDTRARRLRASQDVERWRSEFKQDPSVGHTLLRQLRDNDLERYLTLVHALARDSDQSIRTIGLRELAFHGKKGDREAEEAALAVLQASEPAPSRSQRRKLQIAALLVLGRVGTSRAFLVLYTHAQHGDVVALREAANQAHSAIEQDQLVLLARKFLLAGSFPALRSALDVLGRFSTPAEEEDILLAALNQQRPDVLLRAIGHASPRVLPTMHEILATLSPGTVQYEAATEAIAELVAREEQIRNSNTH